MFDDLAAYFHENVVASYMAYKRVRDNKKYGLSKDLRYAVVAATALYHLREHVPDSKRKSRATIARECPDYDVLGDAVNAAKHRELDRGKPRVQSAKDLYEQIVLTEFEDSDGVYTNSDKLVKARFTDGSERDLYECLTNVMNYWGNEFVSMGFTLSYRAFPVDLPPGSRFIPREDAENLDMELLRGIRFNQNMMLQRFNPVTGSSAPIDLTGLKLSLRIYRPSYTVDAQLIHPTSGKEYSCSLKLDEDESVEWHGLKKDEERERFMLRLAEKRNDEIQQKFLEQLGSESENGSTGGDNETDS